MNNRAKGLMKRHLPSSVKTSYRACRACLARTHYFFNAFCIRAAHRLIAPARKSGLGISEMLEKNWRDYKADIHPKDRRMRVLKTMQISGMGTENTAFLINEVVKKAAPGGVYLEVGTLTGYSLLSAALYNLSTRCIGMDNFSQFNANRGNERTLRQNLNRFAAARNAEFYNKDYKGAISQLFSREPALKVDVYFYDGEHSYENQMKGLEIIKPYLAERCVILIDDINMEAVEKTNADFLKENPAFRSIFKIKTPRNCSETWWNGFEVLTRGWG